MKWDYDSIYRPLFGYMWHITGNYQDSQEIVMILIRMQVPLQTFITGILIYKKISTEYSLNDLINDSNGLGKPYVLIIVSLAVAYKYHNDIAYPNDSWKSISRIPQAEINNLEYKILKNLKFEFESAHERALLAELRNYVPKKYMRVFDHSKKRNVFHRIFCMS